MIFEPPRVGMPPAHWRCSQREERCMSGFAHRWFSVGFIFLFMVASGATFGQISLAPPGQTPYPTATPSLSSPSLTQGRSCDLYSYLWSQALENCRQRAAAGDTQAMLELARAYGSGIYP